MQDAELYALRHRVDELVEACLVERSDLGELFARVLPLLCTATGARGAFFETYSEDLELALFTSSPGLVVPGLDALREATGAVGGARRVDLGEAASGCPGGLVAQPLDVGGAWFGRAGLVGASGPAAAAALDAVCEVVDNLLFSVRASREKHLTMMKVGSALRHRVLAEGLRIAVKHLAEAIPLERMVLVYRAEDDEKRTLHVQTFEGAEISHDTLSASEDAVSAEELRRLGKDFLDGAGDALLARLGVRDAQEELLINGVTKSVVVGKLVATSKRGKFNTWDRELLSSFAGFIRQRIVDFNKEWRSLAVAFRADDVSRLLSTDDYRRTHLAPREAEVAILYADIAGFTRLSETVLRTPEAVANLVERWSRDVVELVWRHGGVFDKMVGDCIIALFGPPFYDAAPPERLAQALHCADAIREATRRLPERPGFEAIREAGMGVAVGVNLAPLFVGVFGPNDNFTGFSSGMNNTARLQGCAVRDEILVMEGALATLGEGSPFRFGPARTAPVKNVAEPLRFRALEAADPKPRA